RGEMIVPEESHLLFERPLGLNHPDDPPKLKVLSGSEFLGIKSLLESIFEFLIVDLVEVQEFIYCCGPILLCKTVNLVGGTAKTHAPQEVGRVVIRHRRHESSFVC